MGSERISIEIRKWPGVSLEQRCNVKGAQRGDLFFRLDFSRVVYSYIFVKVKPKTIAFWGDRTGER